VDSTIDTVVKIANRIREKQLSNNNEVFNTKTNVITQKLIDIFDEDCKEWADLMDEFSLVARTHLATTIRLMRELDIDLFEQALNDGDPEAVEYEDSLE